MTPAVDAQSAVVSLVLEELSRARTKFPAGFHSGHEGYAVIQEELDELWQDVKRDRAFEAACEAIQVAAMALRFIDDCVGFDGFAELWRQERGIAR